MEPKIFKMIGTQKIMCEYKDFKDIKKGEMFFLNDVPDPIYIALEDAYPSEEPEFYTVDYEQVIFSIDKAS